MLKLSRAARRSLLFTSVATALIAVPATAQVQDEAASDEERITSSEDIVVQGQIGYRNREEDSAVPTLVYDTDYFQRFEPLTAGDALRRVPSVTFLSDVIESDGARLRGLPPAYTQITINGERVPGSNADRSFFLDRIPAELISRVEIVRSSTARRTGDAVAGTLNIVLRDGLELDGGYIRAGGLYFNDDELEPSFGAVLGTGVGDGRLLLGLNVQGRHNPKIKFSERFGDSPENNPTFRTDDFDNREDQTDTRDGTDYSFNAAYNLDGATTDIELSAFIVRTDRIEDERSFEYNDPTAITGPIRRGGNLLTDNANVAEIDQFNYSLEGRIEQEWSLGETELKLSFSRFDEDRYETEDEIDFDRSTPRLTSDLTTVDIRDSEFSVRLEHAFPLGDDIDFVIGGFWQDKDRDTNIRETRNRFNVPITNWNQFVSNPSTFAIPFGATTPPPGGENSIEEQRRDFYALVEGDTGPLRWEFGVRYESTDLTINDFTVASALALQTNDYDEWLPSASLRWDLTSVDRLTASVARTNRRPNFDFISPALLEAELGDNDLLGNPQLDPETAWGVDIGYERRIGRTGVIGVNVFYRRVRNLIELTNTGVEGSEGPGTFVLQPANVGNGEVYGVEFDMSTSLGFLGMPNTGVFANVSWLDSEVTDFAGTRRFNGQSDYVFNVGFIQDLPSINSAFGVTYREQGDAFDRIVGEEIFTSYGGELEAFIEHRIGNRATIRLVASNLLDGSKDEIFNKFTTIDDQLNRDFDEYELETENAGPVFQIMVRYAF
jgi:outer membrane receptor protein involved in Fe transport